MAPIYRDKVVSADVNEYFKEFDNENVKENEDNRLLVWNRIFNRVLERDGVRYLHENDQFRFNVKTRAYEAMGYQAHSVGVSAELVMDVIEQIEYFNIQPDEIVVGKKQL